ncbi:ataxin-2 homolog isoform X2 [Procambarus clarkii]|uniref:ataxin-2 homolog isoform X2 n=1 Tax=Procambarus clarkii TaxID=6728 RepID=UPI003742C3F6
MSRGARRAGHLTLLQVCVLCLGCRPSSSFTPTSSLILQSNEHLKGDNLPENSTSEATSDSGDQLCGERSADDPTPHCISAPREYPGRQANNGDDLGNEGEVAAVDDPTSRGEETTVHDPQKKPSDQDSLVRPTTVAGRSRTEGITRVVGLEGRRVVGLLPIVAPHVASRTSLGQRGRRAVDVLSMVAPSAASRMGRRQAQLIYQDEISVLSPKKPSGESSGEVQVSLTQLQQEEEEEEGGHSVFHQQQQLERVPVLSSLPRQQQQDNTSPLPQTQHDDFTSLGQQNNSPSQQHQHTRPSTQQQHQQHKGGSLLQKQQLNDHSLTHQQQLNDHSLTHQQPHNDHSLTHQQQHNNHSLTHQQQLNDHSLTHQQQHNNHSLTHQQQLNDHSLTHQQNYPSSVLQPDMDALRNLSLYYASLSWDKNDEGSRVEVPTPHQVLSHRRYLLMLLQKLRNVDEAMKVSTGNPANSFVTVSQSNPVTVLQSQEERVLPTGVPLLQHTHSATERWRGTSETEAPVPLGSSDPPDGGKSPNRSSTPVYQVPGGQISKPSNRDPSVSRIEQAPLDSLPDTQNLDVGPSSPPFNPLHSQGLLPSSFLGQVPSTTTPPTRLFDLLYDIQTANLPLASSINAPAFSVQQQSESMGSAAGYQGELPQSLLSVALQNGVVFSEPSYESTNQPPSVLLGEPSEFSDYSVYIDSLVNLNDLANPPNVIWVSGQNFQQADPPQVAAPPSIPVNVSEEPASGAQQDTAILQTTQLTTALANFINNILAAINQLITELQAAITANPALAFLLFLPLLLLPFLLHHKVAVTPVYKYGGYGGYHRRAHERQGQMLIKDDLVEWLHHHFNHLERALASYQQLDGPTRLN